MAKLKKLLVTVPAFAIAALLPAVSQADIMLEFRNQSSAPGGAGATAVSVYVTEDFVRINEEAGSWTLYDRGADTVFIVDEKQKEYTPLDRAAISAMSVQMKAAREQMRAQLEKMTPEQRAMVEQMVGHPVDMEPGSVEYQDTGERKTVNGYDCGVGKLVSKGETREEICTAKPRAIGMSVAEYQSVRNMYSLMAELQEASGFGGGMPSYDRLDGLPIEIKSRDGGTQVISRVSHGDVDTRLFRVPEGFKRVSPAGTTGAEGEAQSLR